jgi:hypothetical protein
MSDTYATVPEQAPIPAESPALSPETGPISAADTPDFPSRCETGFSSQ